MRGITGGGKSRGAGPREDDDIGGKIYDAALMRRLLPYLKPHWKIGLLSIVLSLLSVGAELCLPLLQRHAIDINIMRDRDMAGLLWTVGLYIGLMLVSFGLSFLLIIMLATVSQRILYDLRVELFSHLQSLSLRFFNRNPVGRLLTRISSDVELITALFTDVILNSFRDIMLLVGALVMMLVVDWKLTLQVFVVLPLMLAITALFRAYVRRGFRATRLTLAAANGYLQENIAGIRTVQAFVREDRNQRRYDKLNKDYLDANIRTILCFALYLPSVEFVTKLGTALVILFGAMAVYAGRTEIGIVFAFIGWMEMFFRPIRNLAQKYNTLQMAMASAERVCDLLDTKPDIVAPATPRELPAVRGRIEFDDVWFAYEGEDWVLRGVSFVVEPGQTVALVGRTGAGKTTIISLLSRFYDVQQGRILLDGIDIRELDPLELRRRISLVQQDIFLFSGDVFYNVGLGDPAVTPQQVHRACKLVNADRFITRLHPPEGVTPHPGIPPGYAAQLGERGITLSVGERQLVAFARALAADPAILVLDEATSSVDTETERLIQEALDTLLRGRSALVVAHRLSTIERASNILVMHKGHVREQGTHQALLRQDGLYKRLYELQYKEQSQAKER